MYRIELINTPNPEQRQAYRGQEDAEPKRLKEHNPLN